jgi:hypothetical protein
MFSYYFDLQRVSTTDVLFSQISDYERHILRMWQEDDVPFQGCDVFWHSLALGLKRKIELAWQHKCREM